MKKHLSKRRFSPKKKPTGKVKYTSHPGIYGWSFSVQRGNKKISRGHGYNSLRNAKKGVAALSKALKNPIVEINGVREK